MTRLYELAPDAPDEREWLLATGTGGYAMGTLSGLATRRYHGILIAATPHGRFLTLAAVDAFATEIGGETAAELALSANQYAGVVYPDGLDSLRRVEVGRESVAWTYARGELRVTRTLTVENGQDAAGLAYRNEGAIPIRLTLRPLLAMRDHHGENASRPDFPERIQAESGAIEITQGTTLRLAHEGAVRTPVEGWYYRFEHARERERGLPFTEDLYCPCELTIELRAGESFTLRASVGEEAPGADVSRGAGGDGIAERLAATGAKFVVRWQGRRGIIAGYPWFGEWGRDTMIALPGLCLATGEIETARRILLDYGSRMKGGLIPNRLTEDGGADYNTADATLLFADAVYRTLEADWDAPFAERALLLLEASVDWHVRGTEFGIKMDPADGLLTQGGPGLQLTWMDAKIGDWVVTPRMGKAIEICALWINMVRIVLAIRARLGRELAPAEDPYAEIARLASESFERRFWHEETGRYFDVVDPDDLSLRPNAVIAMGLAFTPCDPGHARRALAEIRERLLTPVGLRTLAPGEPGYRGRFEGNMRELDSAYHQGTVWPWLLGPYARAVRRFGDPGDLPDLQASAAAMMDDLGVEGIAECYDGDPPHRPGGCPFQAWSLAAFLDALAPSPGARDGPQ